MSGVVVIVLVVVMSLVLLDAVVLGGVVLLRHFRVGAAAQRPALAFDTVLYTVPADVDPLHAMESLAATGYAALTDPEDLHLLLISCPRGTHHRDVVRTVLSRESGRRSDGSAVPSGPVRFADEA